MNDTIYYIALNSVFGYEVSLADVLLNYAGSPSAVFSLSQSELNGLLPGKEALTSRLTPALLDEALRHYDFITKSGYTCLTRDELPLPLLEIPDPPLVLYINSSTPDVLFEPLRRLVAIVGTRDNTLYGKNKCEAIVKRIAECCPDAVIVSGLATGCDFIAHKAALENGLSTIAVMGTGLERIYPGRHWDFAMELARRPGCGLITDFNPYTQINQLSFLRRNRIIAAASEHTIVVESPYKGGSMSTARYAFDYSRGVWALPGKVDDIKSQGCNMLIADDIASIISDIDNLPYNIGLASKRSGRHKAASLKAMVFSRFATSKYRDRLYEMLRILEYLRCNHDRRVDEVAEDLGMKFPDVAVLVTFLEGEGVISRDLFGVVELAI